MYKKFLLIAMFLLSIMLCACTQAQPNPGTRFDARGPNEDTQESHNSGGETGAESEVKDSMETDYYGLGTVVYEVASVDLAESWDAASISVEDIINARELGTGDRIVLVSINVSNIDVSPDVTLAKEALINCFRAVTKKELDEDNSYKGANGAPGPASAGIEASYFNNAYREDGVLSDNRYFQYELPKPGESVELVLGWIIAFEDMPAFLNNEFFLQHSVSGECLLLKSD